MYVIESLDLKPLDFYQREHQLIYEALSSLWSRRTTIDVVTLSDELSKGGDNLDLV